MRNVAIALWFALMTAYAAGQAHPNIPEGATTRTCLQCHSDHVRGQAVHAAIAQCGNCHQLTVEGTTTTIAYRRPRAELCVSCHKKSQQKTMHGPYRAGTCTDCHDPHRSDKRKLLRASPSTLCSGCHVSDFRGTKIDYAAKTVTLPWKKTLTTAEFAEIPKIELDDGGVTGHPVPVHPVSGINSRGTGQITCLTCHHQHSSETASLVRKSEKGSSICTTCHPGMGS